MQTQTVDQLIGAQRLMAGQKRLQHLTPDQRQPLFSCGTDCFGMSNSVARAPLMVMIGLGEYSAWECLAGQVMFRLQRKSNVKLLQTPRAEHIYIYILHCNKNAGRFRPRLKPPLWPIK